jgi:hypothetical protein
MKQSYVLAASLDWWYTDLGANKILPLLCASVYEVGDTRYRCWVRYYATSQQVAGSIPDEAIGFFQFT